MRERLKLVGVRRWLVLRGYDPSRRLPVDPAVIRTDQFVRENYSSAGVLPLSPDGQRVMLGGHNFQNTTLWGPLAGSRLRGEDIEDTALREGREESGGYVFDLLPPTIVVRATENALRLGAIFPAIVGSDTLFKPNEEVARFAWFDWGGVAELMDWEMDVGDDYLMWGSEYTWAVLKLWIDCVLGGPLVCDPEGDIFSMMHRIVSIENVLGIGGSIYRAAKNTGQI